MVVSVSKELTVQEMNWKEEEKNMRTVTVCSSIHVSI